MMNDLFTNYQLMDERPQDMQTGLTSGHYMHEQLVQVVQECQATCEHMSHHIKRLPDFQSRLHQAMLLRECADICSTTAKALARNSVFARQTAALCAVICEACGKECEKFPDRMSQHCAKICMHCARECADFARM